MREKFHDHRECEPVVGDGSIRLEVTNANGTDFIEDIVTLRAYDKVTDVRWRLPDRLMNREDLWTGITEELLLEFEEYRARNEQRGLYG